MGEQQNMLTSRKERESEKPNLAPIPLGKMVKAPIASCVKAQFGISEDALEAFKKQAFHKDGDLYVANTISFYYTQDNLLKKISVPVLLFIPDPFLAIDSVELSMVAELSSYNSNNKIEGYITNRSKRRELSAGGCSVNINVKLGACGLTNGLTKLLQFYGNDGIRFETREQEKSENPISDESSETNNAHDNPSENSKDETRSSAISSDGGFFTPSSSQQSSGSSSTSFLSGIVYSINQRQRSSYNGTILRRGSSMGSAPSSGFSVSRIIESIERKEAKMVEEGNDGKERQTRPTTSHSGISSSKQTGTHTFLKGIIQSINKGDIAEEGEGNTISEPVPSRVIKKRSENLNAQKGKSAPSAKGNTKKTKK